MNHRLIRALQRGGVAAEGRADTWNIWRARDRRGRIIGTISCADIECLRLREDLRPLGHEAPELLVWAGKIEPQRIGERGNPSLPALDNSAGRTLLERLIKNCLSQHIRGAMRTAVHKYQADLEVISRRHDPRTMNWDTLKAGRDETKSKAHFTPVGGADRFASKRLSHVEDAIDKDGMRLLDLLVLKDASRAQIARALELRPAIAERGALAVLRTLMSVYCAED